MKLFSGKAAKDQQLPDAPKTSNGGGGWTGGERGGVGGGGAAMPPPVPGSGQLAVGGFAAASSANTGGVGDSSNDDGLRDAMIGGPASLDELNRLGGTTGGGGGDAIQQQQAGGGSGGLVGGEQEGQEEGEGSQAGSASASGESEAEGEFKGGKGDSLTSRYLIEKEVGRGTFGRVLRCVDKKANAASGGDSNSQKAETNNKAAKVAIKVVHDAGRYYELSVIEVCRCE
jgi:hypothetical protein